ncbi:MAG: hypothetical protein GY943_32905 [Chloroflexi bacterium]|nr:hypothetical protein [Chloroflexota bacterium]
MQNLSKAWSQQVKQALKSWHQAVILGQSALAELTIVEQRRLAQGYTADLQGRAKAVRDVLRDGIRALGVPDSTPPVETADPAWFARDWRTTNLLTLLFVQGLPRGEVQQRIGLAEGGQYYDAQRIAINQLATLIQDWEGAPNEESTPIILEYPSGAMKLSDTFYIARHADQQLRDELCLPGHTVTITGPRQVGKTSMLVRGVQAAKQAHDARVVYLDMQAISQESLSDRDGFMHEFALWIVDDLDLDDAELDKIWQRSLGSARKLTKLLDRYVLPAIDAPLILVLDEVDRLLLSPFHAEFFGLLRSWHNMRSRNVRWEQFGLLMAISTEPYLLINDLQQSPFNVGLMLYLHDFDHVQLHELNQRYGAPLDADGVSELMVLLHGQPFLTRVALYTLVREQLSIRDLIVVADQPTSPFLSHLRYQRQLLATDPALQEAMKALLSNGRSPTNHIRYRLLKAGLIKQDGTAVTPRCQLYRRYFVNEL